MQYNGYEVGPVIRRLRKQQKMSVEELSGRIGLSGSSIKQLEQGGRNMSMNTLFQLMEVFQCDANTILNITIDKDNRVSLDRKLEAMPKELSEYLTDSFQFMINKANSLI